MKATHPFKVNRYKDGTYSVSQWSISLLHTGAEIAAKQLYKKLVSNWKLPEGEMKRTADIVAAYKTFLSNKQNPAS